MAKDKIQSRTAAPLSAMPTGLLNSFKQGEILDIMAYLRSVPAKKE